MKFLSILIFSLCVCGCVRAPSAIESNGVPSDIGDPDGPPSIQVLPTLTRNSPEYTQRAREGLMVARGVLKATLPRPPAEREFDALQKWLETKVVAWIEERNKGVDATRFSFIDPLDSTPEERVVAHAVIGILQEDTALSLLTIPVPTELDSEPEITALYLEQLRTHTAPFINAALIEFRDCAHTAVREGPLSMRRWARFCVARFQRLQAEHTL